VLDGYRQVLIARAVNPTASLAEIASALGMSKHTYAARLRRAFRYAEAVSA
jgi:DNA-directed RNA polymerase specialized sigma24 family protein